MISGNIGYFAGLFYQVGFITRQKKTDAVRESSAGVLLDGVLDNLESARDKERRFHDFISIFDSEEVYGDIFITLKGLYSRMRGRCSVILLLYFRLATPVLSPLLFAIPKFTFEIHRIFQFNTSHSMLEM